MISFWLVQRIEKRNDMCLSFSMSRSASRIYPTMLVSALMVPALQAGVFSIGSFTFDDYNAVRTAEVVEGPTDLKVSRNDEFTKRAVLDIITDKESQRSVKQYKFFDRTRTVGYLLGAQNAQGIATYVSLPEKATAPPTPNIDSTTIEFTWGHSDLRNISGEDGGPDLLLKLQSGRGSALREELLKQPGYNPGVVGGAGSATGELRGSAADAGGRRQADAGPRERTRYQIGWGLESKPGQGLVVYVSRSY